MLEWNREGNRLAFGTMTMPGKMQAIEPESKHTCNIKQKTNRSKHLHIRGM